ncbi:chordopox L2 protein family [Bovine papular stomatitis virus]
MIRQLVLERVSGIGERARADRRYLEAIQRHAEGNSMVMRRVRRLLFDLVLTAFVIMFIVLRMVMRNAAACATLALLAALVYLFLCLVYF